MASKFFHTLSDQGEIRLQDGVLRDEAGRYFVQLFSFVDGMPSTQRYLTQAEIQTTAFYDNREQMQQAYFRAHPDLDRNLSDFATSDLDDDD